MTELKDLTQIINNHNGSTAYVIAHGPSLKSHLEDIKNTSSDKVIISCNDVDIMTDIIPHYWVFANSIQTVVSMKERFRKFPDCIIVHADSVDSTPRSWIQENLENKYVGYDQRHFENKKCSNCYNGCGNLVEGRKTIQEIFSEYSKINKNYSTAHTVSTHMFSLAVLLGCKNIFLFGVDLNYSLGYVDGKTTNNESFSPWIPEILSDFKVIMEGANLLGVNVYNMSPHSPLNTFLETREKL